MSLHPRKMLLATILFCTVFSLPSQAYPFFAGAKAAGMGSVGIAYAQDAFAGAFNPAGILEVANRIDLGADWVYRHGEAHINIKKSHDDKKCNGKFKPFGSLNTWDFAGGLNKTFCFPYCGEDYPVAFGVVAYEKKRYKTSFKKVVPLFGRTKPGLDFIHGVISPIVCFGFAEDHNIGVSVDFHIQRLNVRGIEHFKHRLFSAFPHHLTNRGNAHSSGVGATIGWTWKAIDGLIIGVVYRTKTKMKRFDRYKGFIANHGKLDTPPEWGLGFAYQFLPCATFSVDFEWIQWSEIKAWRQSIVRHHNIEKLRASKGSGFGFRDQFSYRMGIDYAVNEFWTVRAGYEHVDTPTRRSQAMLNLLLCNICENTVSIGATYIWNRYNEISCFYAHSFENTIHGKHSIPHSFGSGSVEITECKEFLGISWGLLF